MKILFTVHGFPPETSGGTEATVEALARAFQRAGHGVVVVAGSLRSGDPAVPTREDHDGLRVLRMHRDDLYYESWFKAHSPAVSGAFAQVLRAERPDVVHVHHWLRLSSDLARLARAHGCATAVTCHDYFAVLARPVRRIGEDEPTPPTSPPYVGAAEAHEAFMFHRADFADELRAAHVRFAPSRAQADGLASLAGAEPAGDFLVSSPPQLGAPLSPLPRSGPRGRRLATWGAIYPEKGLGTVLDAMAHLSRDGVPGGRVPGDPVPGDPVPGDAVPGNPAYTLDVYGAAHDPAFAAQLATRAAGLPITFHGAFTRADLAQLAADYAVLPSLAHESYGLVLDEALQLGLPVLAADVPAYRERAPASSAQFFAAGDAEALARILAEPATLARLEPPSAPTLLDAEAAAARLLASYQAALARRGEAYAPRVTDAERARQLFRRAERRLWTALKQADPPAPPDDFLARDA